MVATKKISKLKRGLRVVRNTALVGLVAVAGARGVKEINAIRSAQRFKQETISQITTTPSGKTATLIYTKSLNRKHPQFKKNVELRASAIRGLEQAIKKNKSGLDVLRIMNTLENSSVNVSNYKFNAGQIMYTPSSSIKEACTIYNSLPFPTRKMLYEMSLQKGTNAELTRQLSL